nr:unnamed protein product [Callosobruchus chinensis]CAH7767654.1 unnamed protein product [Callosobruchus chinensis]
MEIYPGIPEKSSKRQEN